MRVVFFIHFIMNKNGGGITVLLKQSRKIAQEKRKPLVQVALNWLIQQSGVTTALVGARTIEQVEKNAQAIQGELSESDLIQIEEIYHRFFKNFS